MREKLGLLGCLAALGVLLLCSADTARAVREGLALCAGSVIPALFPFLAVSGLLTALDAAGVRPPAFAAAFVRSVRDAAGAMVQICGFVVFFLAALRLTARLTGLSHPLLSGAVELTQGILALPATPTGFVWAAALLGWGGLSVHGQSAAVLSGTDLPLGPYLAAKAAQAALSALLAWPVSRYLWG